jgi:hypothetical protein
MPIDPTRPTDTPRDYDYDPQPDATPTTPTTGTTTAPRGPVNPDDAPDPLAGQSHGRASAEFVRRQTAASRANDGVIYLGMNSTGGQNAHEAARLGKAVRHGTEVDVIAHGEDSRALGPDKVRVEGPDGQPVVADLSTNEGVQTFVTSLHLPTERQEAVAQVIQQTTPSGRDEIAGLAQVLARGERGEPMPGRLVISGHCSGTQLWDGGADEKLGQMTLQSIKDLAQALPAGAAHVKELMFSACSTGYDGERARDDGKVALSSWKDAFPSLQTAWGYGGPTNYHSPTGVIATQHVADWEKTTRGGVDHLPAHSLRVSTWSTRDGYRMGNDQ